jgi:hypothetical protein
MDLPRLDRRPAILIEVFMGFLILSRRMLGQYLKLGHSLLLSNPFEFIIHLSSVHSTLYSLSY